MKDFGKEEGTAFEHFLWSLGGAAVGLVIFAVAGKIFGFSICPM